MSQKKERGLKANLEKRKEIHLGRMIRLWLLGANLEGDTIGLEVILEKEVLLEENLEKIIKKEVLQGIILWWVSSRSRSRRDRSRSNSRKYKSKKH